MSAKWQRSKRWDEEHLTGRLRPARFVLRAFSSITLAVILLTCVAMYGVLASVPLGLLISIPTYVLYGLTLILAVAAGVGLQWLVSLGLLRKAPRGSRFAVNMLGVLLLGGLAAALWLRLAWPALHYDPARGTGLMLFADAVEAYKATTIRRLPALEMSELEFYSWWPLRLVLLLFVANMVTATVRRIEFSFPNLGVLMVHTGIVLLALGSVYYNGLKLEGDTILFAGQPDQAGTQEPGPPQEAFYDNTDVALFVQQGIMTEQRALRGVPRYNDYNLAAAPGRTASEAGGARLPWLTREGRRLSLAVPGPRAGRVDGDLRFRVVGYAAYADTEHPVEDWVRVGVAQIKAIDAATRLNPLRIVHLISRLPDEQGRAPDGPVFAFNFAPASPRDRVADNGVLSVEWTLGMPEDRWAAVASEIPPGAERAIIAELPERLEPAPRPAFRAAYSVAQGAKVSLGDSGYSIEVKEVHKRSPMPLVTEGYRGADSPMLVLRVTEPSGRAYDRWVYERFPEIAQDLLDRPDEQGRTRRPADPALRVWYVDATQLRITFDERGDGSVRAVVRQPRLPVRVVDPVPADPADPSRLFLGEVVPMVDVRLTERWEHSERFARPRPVEEGERERRFIGTHDRAMLAVEVTSDRHPGIARVVWLPFAKYLELGPELRRQVVLPDGRRLSLAFGRRQYRMPEFELRLVGFEMVSYDHRGAPRDYQSLLRVDPTGKASFEPYEHVTRLNAPLTAPFHWRDDRAWLGNMARRLAAGLNPAQFKFSQAGWDAQGWQDTQAQADAGLLPRPFVRFTILGVGNNPGIHAIALGGILMGVGIPWAFYFKPYLLRRRKRTIQARLRAEAAAAPATTRPANQLSEVSP
ncbi:MAG: hypothetical protein FJ255_05360 [Phycisphaerae bacterium]|nr:hypothetical protein [Phycisphaerae bacterium]